MNKQEFLRKLEQSLRIKAEEKDEVMRYYTEYFEEAGPENEQAVLKELGDPRVLAEKLNAECETEGSRVCGRDAESIIDESLRFAERTTRSVFTSLKDIFGGGQTDKEIHEFSNHDMEPFHTIRVDVENCPISVALSRTDRYGVDAKFVVGDQTEWEINVVDGILIVTKHTSRRMKSQFGFSGNSGKNSEYVRIYLPKVAMDIVELISSNASIQVEDVCTQTLIAETSNAVIRITDTKVLGELRADTSNGSIEIQLTGTENEYTIHADTSNAKVYVDGRVRGDEYHSHGGAKEVRLDTSNGRITIGFTGVN